MLRTLAAMAFDPTRNVAVLFGGLGAGAMFADTWEFDGATWLQRSPAGSPSPRSRAGCTWSPSLSQCVLFGAHHPAATLIPVPCLALPQMLIEVEAIAALPA